MARLPAPCVALLLACTSTSAPPSKSESAPEAEPAPTPNVGALAKPEAVAKPGAIDRLACAADAECMASCRHGAVTRAWHSATYPGGEACEDGCTSKGTEPPRCEAGQCVARRAGARDPQCTAVDAEVIAGAGPAHRCGADEHCTLTCEYGAVNAEWFSWQTPTECGGGCTNPGHDPPRCVDGRCVAYRGGEVQSSCTERPIPR